MFYAVETQRLFVLATLSSSSSSASASSSDGAQSVAQYGIVVFSVADQGVSQKDHHIRLVYVRTDILPNSSVLPSPQGLFVRSPAFDWWMGADEDDDDDDGELWIATSAPSHLFKYSYSQTRGFLLP